MSEADTPCGSNDTATKEQWVPYEGSIEAELRDQREQNRSLQQTILELQDEIKDHERKENEQLEVIKNMEEQERKYCSLIDTLSTNARPRVGLILDLMDANANDESGSLAPHSDTRITLRFFDGVRQASVAGLWTNHPVLLKYAYAEIEGIDVTPSGELRIDIAQEDW